MQRWCLLNLTVQGFSLNLTVRGVSNKHCLLTFFIRICDQVGKPLMAIGERWVIGQLATPETIVSEI